MAGVIGLLESEAASRVKHTLHRGLGGPAARSTQPLTALDTRPPRLPAPRRIAAPTRLADQVWPTEHATAIFDAFMAATPAVAFVKDSAGRYRWVNRQFLEQFGERMGSEWFGKTDAEVWPADIAALVRANDATALAADRPVTTTQLMPIGETRVPFLVTKFPIHIAQGVLLGGIGLDITQEQALAALATSHARQRALIANTLANLPTQATSEAIAQMICRQVVSLSGIVAAAIMQFAHDDRARPIGFALANGGSPELPPVPYARSRHLHERAAQGAWIEASVKRSWLPYDKTLDAVGMRAQVYAPIHHAGRLIGVLAVGSARAATAVELAESIPALVEFAGLTGALIGPNLVGQAESMDARRRIAEVIDRRAFHPVFQPIMDLKHDRVVGYEALTRFDDGTAAGQFAAAEAVGLGLALETATLRAALAEADGLGRGVFLNLNASPALVLEGRAIRSLVRGARHRVVLEITEHSEITDYDAFHRAVAGLPRSVCLAVDDAGAGFASFRHILELRPKFVKLDRSLVEGIDRDPAKQALVAGMHRFAHSSACRLIAEGVETENERGALVRLGIRLAQGYLLGRPGPLPVDYA
jgi:EAL domain-containing protein (putative c-di-GMP-specific phosphodiesterase class I)/PAS domain-containing protein